MGAQERDPVAKLNPIWWYWLAGLAVSLAALLAFANGVRVPLVLDDEAAITNNPAIRRLTPLGPMLFPDSYSPLVGRPLASLTFALNYASSGIDVKGYHVVNLIIHALAGAVLFGFLRRTLARVRTRDHRSAADGSISADAALLSLLIALAWAVHPLLTSTVTYISQRTEGLMGLFYLLTLYAFVRGADSRSGGWLGVSVASCALGMASKEVMVTAPFIVWLYDRCFVSGSFRAAVVKHRIYYAALLGTWLLLFLLMRTGEGTRNVGYGQGVTLLTYVQTECYAVVRYLWLTLWPQNLVFDYGLVFVTGVAVVPFALLLLVLLMGAGFALWRWPRVGFVLASFFILLSPTSSLVPVVGQPIAENRVYLPSIAVVVLLVLGFHRALGRRAIPVVLALVVAAGVMTNRRNRTYSDAIGLWADTALKWPRSARAHSNLGQQLFVREDFARAAKCFEQALAIDPEWADALINLGTVLVRRGEIEKGIALQQKAVELKPTHAGAHFQLGNSFYVAGRKEDAGRSFARSLQFQPDNAEVWRNLAVVLDDLNRFDEARQYFERAIQLRPDFAEGFHAYAITLARHGRPKDALAYYERALQLQPAHAQIRHNYGAALLDVGRVAEAIVQEREALRLDPGFALAHANLAVALSQANSLAEALTQAETALRLDATLPLAYSAAGKVLLQMGRLSEAEQRFAQRIQLSPNVAEAHFERGVALYQQRKYAEAVTEFETADRLQPGSYELQKSLASGLSQVGREAEAVAYFQALVRIKPDDANLRSNFGLVLARLGRTAEAVTEFEAVLRVSPADAFAREQRDRLRQQLETTPRTP